MPLESAVGALKNARIRWGLAFSGHEAKNCQLATVFVHVCLALCAPRANSLWYLEGVTLKGGEARVPLTTAVGALENARIRWGLGFSGREAESCQLAIVFVHVCLALCVPRANSLG